MIPNGPAARLAAVDGLRGFAALMVVASHASGLGIDLLPGVSLEGIGKYGVYLFFVISAFLLTAQWLRFDAERRHAPRTLARYLVRRVARIYPLYTLVLLVGWALPRPGLGVPLDAAAVWRHLSLQDGQGIYWSIPVEFLYYLVIPPLAWWLQARIAVWWRVAVVAAVLGLVMWCYPPSTAPLNSFNLAYYLPALACGSLSAWWLHLRPALGADPDPPPLIGMWDGVVLAAFLLTLPALFTFLGWGEGPAALHRAILGWGVFWSLVLIGMQTRHLALTARLMRWPGLGACGRWCFGIYLLHMPALYAAKHLPVPGEFKGWLGLALALALAALAHRFIERPAMQRARLWL